MSDVDGIRLLMRRAFEQAFSQQIMSVYRVYITNTPSQLATQREKTRLGIEHAVAAYRLAMEAVENWRG